MGICRLVLFWLRPASMPYAPSAGNGGGVFSAIPPGKGRNMNGNSRTLVSHGHGIGSALLKQLFEVAKNAQCKRVRWQVLNWNTPAIELYKKCGAIIDNEWSNCDFDPKGIQEFKID